MQCRGENYYVTEILDKKLIFIKGTSIFQYIPDDIYNELMENETNFNKEIRNRFSQIQQRNKSVLNKNNFIQPKVITLSIHASVTCNLNCKYCFKPDKVPKNLTFEDVKKYIDISIDKTLNYARKYIFDLSGSGEPLMNFSLIKKIVEYADYLSDFYQMEFLVVFATNATLLTKEIIDYLQKNNVMFGISFDGSKDINNNLRYGKNHLDMYSVIKDKVQLIENKTLLGIATTLTAEHSNLIGILNSLLEIGNTVSIKPVRSDDPKLGLNRNNIEKFLNEYKELTYYLVEQTLKGEYKYINSLILGDDYFGGYIATLLSGGFRNRRCDAGFGRISLYANKKIYGCMVGILNKDFVIGDLENGLNIQKMDKFKEYTTDNNSRCNDCFAKYICGGECHIVSYNQNGKMDEPNEIMCLFKQELIKLAAYFISSVYEQKPDVIEYLTKTVSRRFFHNCSEPATMAVLKIFEVFNKEEGTYNSIKKILEVSSEGVKPDKLLDFLKINNIFIQEKKIDFKNLYNVSFPFLIPCNITYSTMGYYNYILVLDFNKEEVIIFDSLNGNRSINPEKLLKYSTGNIIELYDSSNGY